MARRADEIRHWLTRLHDAAGAVNGPLTFMEVCGTHTMSAFRCGLHSLMPANVKLLSGPGCPVCVTAQGDIDLLIEAALLPRVTLCTYGDMLRVPGRHGSLERARGRGAEVRVVYSALDAVRLAQREPHRQVVFGAVGFETTAPATAAAVLQAHQIRLNNFSVMASHKCVIPAMLGLLAGGQVNVQGFLCPGHVSVVIGAEAYRPIVEKHGLSCVIAGFEDVQMAAGLARLCESARDGRAELVNQYTEAVTPTGNAAARRLLDEVFEPADMCWRGLGEIPQSGLKLRPQFAMFDTQQVFGLETPPHREPAKCLCGKVITGLADPNDCELFGSTCTPISPIGPCMVSGEGTCQAWFKYHRHTRAMRRATVETVP